MPCKIQIKENITRNIEDRTNDAFGKPLAVAQSIARNVNASYGTTVVRFVQREADYIDRIIEVSQPLIDQYYYNELELEEQEARQVQQEDAARVDEEYSDEYMFQTKSIFSVVNEIENKLKPINKTINSIGSEKNIDDVLKKAGLDSELRKQFIQLVNNNPSLKSLKVSEVLGTYLKEFVKDSDRQYYKAIDEPLSNKLEDILIDYFDKFKIRRQELDNLKEKFGVDSVGVFDVLAKTVYYAKNRNLLTLPEEYGHVFVELLGSIGNKKADNPLFKYMFDNIDKWDGYQRVLRDYKNVYVTKEGNMDIYKIKKEAIGQAIGIALVRNYKVQEGDKDFWAKIQGIIDYILDLIKGVDYVSLNTTVDSIAKDILNKNYDKLDRMKKDTSNYNLLTYSETIKNQNKIDGGKALKFMQWFSQKGMLITGSLAYRLQGTTYRPEIDALHDIDNIVPSDVHKVSLNKQDYLTPEQLESSRLYYKYISEGNYKEAKKHKLQGNIRLNIDEIVDNVEVLQEFKEQFPDTDFLYSFYNEKANAFYITINAIWSENQELKNRFKSYTGSFNSRLENFTKEELEQIYLFDFFLRPESSEEYKKIEDPEYGLSLAHFNYAFYEKLNMMGRAKDAFDYQMWDYYDDASILAPDFNDRLVYFQTQQPKELSKNVSLQIEGVPASRSSKETIEKIKKIAESAGISFQDLQEYLKGNPEVEAKDVNGLADIMKGIIAIAEGKEDVALTEEFIHVASAIVNQTNPKLITEMISKIDRFKIYQKVLKEYSKDPNYQLPNGKPDIRKIKREAVDKLIAELVIKQSEGSTEFPELMEETNRSMFRRFWEAILDIFRMQYRKANINIFETTSELISSGNLGARYYTQTKPGVQELFESNPELANAVYEALGFNQELAFVKSDNTIDDDFYIKDELIVTKELQNIRTTNWDGSINMELSKLKNKLNQLPIGSKFNISEYTKPTITSLEEVLNRVNLSESNRVLLEKIKPLIENVKIEYVDKFILSNSGAVYSDKYNTIRLNRSEKSIPLEELLMHELLHAATFRKISYFETNTKGLSKKELTALNELENIRKVLKEASDKYWDNRPRFARSVNPLEGYRTDSIHEIISYAFTNKEFRDAIAEIPYKGTKSILDKLVELIATIFGVKQDTILSALLANAEVLLEDTQITPQQKQQAQQQYSQYLNTIFPDSKVKDIVYHGSPVKNITEFNKGNIYFTNEPDEAFNLGLEKVWTNLPSNIKRYFLDNTTDTYKNSYGLFEWTLVQARNKKDGKSIERGIERHIQFLQDNNIINNNFDFNQIVNTYPSILNIKDPNFLKEDERFFKDFKKGKYTGDGIIGKDVMPFMSDNRTDIVYLVFEPEQTYILGGKQDIEGFRNFVETSVVEFKPTESGVFLQKAQQEYTPAQLEIQQQILNTKENIEKRTNEKETVDPILMDTEEASNYYEIKQPDGTYAKITKRVTDRVKAWYKRRFGDKKFSEAQQEFNEIKRELGVKFHYFVEDIHGRYFNPDGTRKQSPGRRTIKVDPVDDVVYQKLEDYFTELVEEFSKDGKNPLVFSEAIVYDPKEQEAGTIDLLIVDENGKANIFDWKFMSISEQANDVPWFKQGAFGIQLSRYRDILRDAYGVKEFGLNRAIPILMDFKRINPYDKNSKLTLKGINIGSVDVSKIEDLKLIPVSEETESTGDKRLDKLIKELNTIYRQISKGSVTTDEEREFKRERMNLLKKAIRSAQSSKDISPMIDVINIMRKEGEQIVNDWETIYDKRAATDKDFENAELSDYADNIREYIAISEVFARIDDLIGNLIYNKEMEATAETKEEKAEVAYRKEVLDQIRDEKSKIANSRDEVKDIARKFADKFMGERNLVKGLLKPEAVWKGVSSFFRGASDSPLASIQILFKLVTNARGKASVNANKMIDELLDIRKSLVERGGNTRELVKKIYQRDDKNNIVNKIVYKYKKEFYTSVDDNAIEGKQDKNWLLKNINVEEYKKEALDMLNKRVKSLSNLYSENEELRNQLIAEEYRKWDISRADFNGWNNYIIKRHPKDDWFSDEYKEIEKDVDLLKLYNFISKVNDEAGDVGYIQNKIHSTFLPFVRKSMAESLAWDFSLSAIMNMGDSLSLRADDVGYGSINELTNELEHSIPKYYTTDFTKKEDGTNDYSDVSEDIFKNMILYINHMQKYKYLSEVEGQLNLIKTVESFKDHYETKRNSDIVMENGKPKEVSGNEDNRKMFDDFLRALFYEQKYPISDADTELNLSLKNAIKKAINKVAGKEIFKPKENPDAISLVKTMDAANRAFQLKTLGFEIISGAVNLFGANVQMATQAGNYFRGREFIKNETELIGNRFKSEDERTMFSQLIEVFMPLKDDPSYDKLQQAGLSKLTNINFGDWLMVFMRVPEQHVEKSIFKTLLDNTMVVDGKLVNIREYVKNKYSDRYSSSEAYRQAANNIDKEIDELKKTKSITATKQLVDGKLVIPGFDLNNLDEIQRLTNLTRRISRNATGGLSDADLNRMQMSIWTKSMMVFKTWIPKLVDTRFGEFRKISDDFSVEIDENGMTTGEKYDIGRIRVFLPFLSANIIKTIKQINDVLSVTEDGLSKLDALYKRYAEDYKKKTGEELTMSKEDFNDLIRNNLRNQIKELTTLMSLLGASLALGLIAPDDDEDRATKNRFRYTQRVVDKFVGELSFFYNPLEIQKLLSGSSFPAIGLLTDITRFSYHITMEFTGIDISDFQKSPEEARKKAQPVKNLAKMFPLTKSLVTYASIFDSEFAKEYDVTIQKESRR